jgi:predicted NUDIX family NTP pyrophosphohydrolase
MLTTCGVLITDGTNYLICHPTGSKWWDLPKGQQDPGESYAETAVREMREETGITATEDQLEFIGVFKYRPKKDLALFKMKVENMPDVTSLRCESKFQKGFEYIAEMDAFQITDSDGCLSKVNPAMNRVLSEILIG